jgi:hypothetical protein
MSSLDDFDRYCEDHDVQPGEYGAAFAKWLANVSGETIIGGPADEPPELPHQTSSCRQATRPNGRSPAASLELSFGR